MPATDEKAAEGTNIAGALHQALELFPEGAARRAVILSDGNETEGDLLREAVLAAGHGVEVSAVPLETVNRPDVELRGVVLPARARPGERVPVHVELVSNLETPATLTIEQGKRKLASRSVDLAPGTHRMDLDVRPGASSQPLVARIEAPGDERPENDTLEARLRVKSLPRAALFSHRPDEDLALAEALESARLPVNVAGDDARCPRAPERSRRSMS
ncbi:MAG: VWA domain-containing protein [Deltaproteobacteria bacterium]|nr:VWA domain-containing protein [Deltaproteobacteria bacterium]